METMVFCHGNADIAAKMSNDKMDLKNSLGIFGCFEQLQAALSTCESADLRTPSIRSIIQNRAKWHHRFPSVLGVSC